MATNEERLLLEAIRQMASFSVVDNVLPEILTRVAVLASETINGADFVGLTMSVDGRLQTPVFTDQMSPEIDSAQYETGIGPCLDAYRYGVIQVIPSTRDDVSWKPFSEACIVHGVLSTLSVPVKTGGETIGALNCYARQERAFDVDARTLGIAFADHAGIVIRNARAYWETRTLGEQLSQALESRASIEQAKGLLMATGMTSDAAFVVLRKASQRSNRKLHHVAADLVAQAEPRAMRNSPSPVARRPRTEPLTGRISRAETDGLFLEYFETRDPDLRERLVYAHLGLAASMAARFSSRQASPEDLHQTARLGLVHAVDRYDPTRGIQFTTFAWATIAGELKRHFRDRAWGLRVPRRVQELYLVTAEAVDNLTSTLGRSPSVAELAARIGTSEEEVLEALDARSAYRLASLDAPLGDMEDGSGIGIQLGDEDPGFGVFEERSDLEALISRLAPRERTIIQLRFHEELTQAQIADRIGVSQMHVSRILTASLTQLRVWSEQQNRPIDV